MLKLTPEQAALLRLPDPHAFIPKLAAEIRRDYPQQVVFLDDTSLLVEVDRSYTHASEQLHITHVPTLVQWVKADVAWAKGLRMEPAADLRIRKANNPNLAAADLLSALAAQSRQAG